MNALPSFGNARVSPHYLSSALIKTTSLQLHQQAGRHDGTDQSRQALALLQEPTGRPCLQLRFLATAHSLDEPVILLFNVGAAKICGPGVADGELMELQHVHDSHLSHGAAKQLRTLVHAGRCGGGGAVSMSPVSLCHQETAAAYVPTSRPPLEPPFMVSLEGEV